MELEFDKEIDAILRKARDGVAVTSTSEPHLDADTIAAFAENALPDKAKLLYIGHFADCDQCRKQLSFLMQMNNEAAVAASAPVAEPVTDASIPWYEAFFKTPNLALAMGALVLAFSGILGYLVIQKQNASDSATVSQVTEPDHDQPLFNRQNEASNTAPANVIAPANVAPATNTAANSSAMMPGRGPSSESDTFGRVDSDQAKSGAARENSFILDGQEVTDAEPPAKAATPPPPVATTGVADSTLGAELDEKKLGDDRQPKEESKDLALAKQKRAEDRAYRDMPRAASKVGPARGAGPAQNQTNQMNSNMPVTRVVGGKTFNNRDGAWYDSAYRNQATANYRRGTPEYKKLDAGLRNIADTLGGTVVVVWKAKAYRIQ